MEHFSVFGHVNLYPHICALYVSPNPLKEIQPNHFYFHDVQSYQTYGWRVYQLIKVVLYHRLVHVIFYLFACKLIYSKQSLNTQPVLLGNLHVSFKGDKTEFPSFHSIFYEVLGCRDNFFTNLIRFFRSFNTLTSELK